MYRMILPETLPDVAAAEAHAAAKPGGSVDVRTVDVRAVDADAAAARTRADYGRVSRWALGLLGTAGAAVAVLIAVFPLSLVGTAGTGQVLFGAVFVAIALAIGIPSVWLLWALHRSGRRLSRAAGYWAGLPYRQGRRSPTRGDWFAVRFLGFSSDLFLRLICSALSGLAAIFTVVGVVRGIATGAPLWEIALWLGWSILFLAVCGGQFWGVQRVQNGYLARDPASLTRGR